MTEGQEAAQGAGAAQSEVLAEGASRQPEEPRKYERVMVVSAHPDDPEFGAGGSVAKLARDGAEVVYVICTDGSQGGEDPSQPDEDLVAIREQEQLAAANVLGVKEVVFLGNRDGYLAPNIELRTQITRQIRKFRPELVITHTPGRQITIAVGASHPDHIAVGEATMNAVYPDARNPRAFRELLAEGLEAWRVKEVWFPFAEQANHFVDISDLLDTKIEAILCHKSQFQPERAGEPSRTLEEMQGWTRERHRDAGKKAGVEYAESFFRTVIEW